MHSAFESDVLAALDDPPFVLHYQPEFDRQGTLVGREALLRWPHQQRGMLPAGDFLYMVRHLRGMERVSNWAIRAACTRLAAWQCAVVPDRARLSVNVEPAEFAATGFADRLLEACREAGADPRGLVVELTERQGDVALPGCRRNAYVLSQNGVGLALDNVGPGPTALGVLRALPFRRIKLASRWTRSWTLPGADQSHGRTLTHVGHVLGCEVIAKGVESEGQQRMLAGLGVDGFQGYWCGRPMPMGVSSLRRLGHGQPGSL